MLTWGLARWMKVGAELEIAGLGWRWAGAGLALGWAGASWNGPRR